MSNKLVKIYSHPRSGTNYLGALLKNNFYKDIDVSKSGGWGHWADPQKFKEPVLHGQIFGSHSYRQKEGYPAIYIYRDGRAVALSIWKSHGFLNKSMKGVGFSEFLREDLDWFCSPARKTKLNNNIIQHWLSHVLKWNNKAHSILMVRYEDLVSKPKKVLDTIANTYSLKYCTRFSDINELVGPSPNSGDIFAWREHFSAKDLNYFYSIVPENCRFLWSGDK